MQDCGPSFSACPVLEPCSRANRIGPAPERGSKAAARPAELLAQLRRRMECASRTLGPGCRPADTPARFRPGLRDKTPPSPALAFRGETCPQQRLEKGDRKSTRLNSS